MAYVIFLLPACLDSNGAMLLTIDTRNYEVPRVDDGRVKKKTSASMDKGMTSMTLNTEL